MYHSSQKLATSAVIHEWVREASKGGMKDSYEGKRAHTRTTWSTPLAVKILSGPDKNTVVMVKAKDVSLGGVGFISRLQIPLHVEVEICAGNSARCVKGRVKHATNTVSGFIIGVEFDTPAPSPTRRLVG